MNERRELKDSRNYFCVIASGETFDVDGYAKSFLLGASEIWHRGEQIANSNTLHQCNGLRIDLGIGADLSIEEQQVIAAEFLSANLTALKSLKSFPGVTGFYLGLQETVFCNSAGSIFDLSPSLMELALKIGLQLTVWSCVTGPYPQ